MAIVFYHLGLIGDPLDHSLSPQLHMAALKGAGLVGEYRLYQIPALPGGEIDLIRILEKVRSGALHGLNVTIPHKQALLSMLDELTPEAQAIGAVNTIYCKGELLVGDNTDAAGFLRDLVHITDTRKTALVLGAGGAARAVVYVLAFDWKQVYVAARRFTRAQELADDLRVYANSSCSITPLSLDIKSLHRVKRECDLIVNATPVGMYPKIDHSPWPDEEPFPHDVVVYDLVYNPPITALVRAAKGAGLTSATGLGMLVEQAGLAFERWTGKKPHRDLMDQALYPYLTHERI